MRDAARRDEEATLAEVMLLALDVPEKLSLEQVHVFVFVGVQCSGVVFPRTMMSSSMMTAPSVSAAVAFHVAWQGPQRLPERVSAPQ